MLGWGEDYFFGAAGTISGVEEVLNCALSVEDVGARQFDDVAVHLDVHVADHAAVLERSYIVSLWD